MFIFAANIGEMNNINEIQIRYTKLAKTNCCLSCGGAVDKSEPKMGDICVDLGSGRGTDVLRLAEKVGNKGFVYGIDITEEMINSAKSTAEKLGIENVDFIKSNLLNIPLKDNSIDLIISNCVLNHVEDKQKVWQEIYRILKNGGRFTISDIYSIHPVPEEYSNDPVAVSECWGGSITRSEYLNVIKIAGFRDLEILEESTPYDKGSIQVASWTITGTKDEYTCCM